MERNLARLHEFMTCNLTALPTEESYKEWRSEKALLYLQASNQRALAMDKFLWSPSEGMWKDYVLQKKGGQLRSPGQGVVSVSSFLPIWSGILDNEMVADREAKKHQVLASLQTSGLVQV